MSKNIEKVALDYAAQIRGLETSFELKYHISLSDALSEVAALAATRGDKVVSGSNGHGNNFSWTVVAASVDKIVDDEKAMTKAWLENGGERMTKIQKGRKASLRKK